MKKRVFGKYTIELKKYTKVQGHDDSLPFQGELWVNKTHVANCWNTGWGEETTIEPLNNALFEDVAKIVCETKLQYENMVMNYTMPILVEELAWECDLCLSIKENQKYNLVFILDNMRMKLISFKSKKQDKVEISELLLSEKGRKLIKDAIMKYENNGWKLANTNIKKVLI